MRVLRFALILLAMTSARAAAEPKLAVFDLELVDTSLDGEMRGPREDEHARLRVVSDLLRSDVARSGRFQMLDMAPLTPEAGKHNLQSCGGCDVQMAQRIGADLVLTGVVQKTSNLILNITFYLRDAHDGHLIVTMNTDLRGNTDQSWSRAISYLVRNRLLAPNYGAPQPP